MRVRKLNLEIFKDKDYQHPDDLLFARPTGGKLFRAWHVPLKYLDTNQYNDIVEILDSTCKIKRHGIWFFDFEWMEILETLIITLNEMGVMALTMEPEEDYGVQGGAPIPEILN